MSHLDGDRGMRSHDGAGRQRVRVRNGCGPRRRTGSARRSVVAAVVVWAVGLTSLVSWAGADTVRAPAEARVTASAPSSPPPSTSGAANGPQAALDAVGTVSLFNGPGVSGASSIIAGPDGNLWFTNRDSKSIGRITTSGVISNFTAPNLNDLWGITAGPDGNLWFTVSGTYPGYADSAIGRITPQGQITTFSGAAIRAPRAIAPGPDGNLWFVGGMYPSYTIARITPTGQASTVTSINDLSYGITAGPDGAMWFTSSSGGSSGNGIIGRVTMTGTYTTYSDAYVFLPARITTGADGNLWFVNSSGCCSSIGKITPTGQLSHYLDTWIKYPSGVAAGPDGNVWFGNGGNVGDNRQIGRIAAGGAMAGFSANGGYASDIAAGADQNMWFTAGTSIGRITTGLAGAGARPTRMVSLGDSYTSGEGLVRGDGLAYDCGTDLHKGSYYENTSVGFGTRWDEACDTVTQGPPPIDYKSRPIKVYENLCHRHGRAWPNQVRESLGIAATNALFVPCSGAIAANLGFLSSGNWAQYWQRSPNGVAGGLTQKETVAPFIAPPYKPVDFVTVGVGGNDAGFADVVQFCLQHECLHDPDKPTFAADTLATINNAVFPRLVETFTNLKVTFPSATILTYGYPRVVDPSTPSCAGIHALGGHAFDLSVEERTWAATQLLPTLNRAVQDAAAAVGIAYMPIEDVTKGHEVCTSDPWVNGVRLGDDKWVFANESFHPNQTAHDKIFEHFRSHYTDGQGRLTFTNPAPNPSVLRNRRNVTVVVGQVDNQPTGPCGASCLQPQCAPTQCQVDLNLSGFSPNTTLTVTANSVPVTLGTAVTDATGHLQTTMAVPAAVPDGNHTLVVSGSSSGGVTQVGESFVTILRDTLVTPQPPPGARYHPVEPSRILDSRTSNGGWLGPLAAGANRTLKVTGLGGASNVPPTASAVVLNLTATGGTAGSFLTVWPNGSPQPNTSNLNFGPGQTIPNLVTVKVGLWGYVALANASGTVDVIADVVGYYDDGSGPGDFFTGITPTRLLDSRTPTGSWNGKLEAGARRDLVVRKPGNGAGVPSTATAIVANVTATSATAASFVSVWPAGVPQPTVSNLNFAAGQTIPNLVMVKIGVGGAVTFANANGAVDLVVDVVGYFDPTSGSKFHAITPKRILDDRVGKGSSGPWGPGETRTLAVTGVLGAAVPVGATGLVANVTATNATAGSFLTIAPNSAAIPQASNLNFGPGQTIPNLVTVQLPLFGLIKLYNQQGTVDVIADAVGYFAAV